MSLPRSARGSVPKPVSYLCDLPDHAATVPATVGQIAPELRRAVKVAARIEHHLPVRSPTIAAVKVMEIVGRTGLIAIRAAS